MREWYFQVMGQELGPFSAAELKAKVESGQIQPDTMVRRGLDGKWLFAEKVKGLMPAKPEPVIATPPAAKQKSSSTMPIAEEQRSGSGAAKSPIFIKGPDVLNSSRSAPMITMALVDDEEISDRAKAPSAEFYDFVGFREAISPVLDRAVRQYLASHHLTMTQLNRRALASFIARPELASDLMISNMSVLQQPVNSKSNADKSHPLSEREQIEQATFRLTLFNCSNSALEVSQGEFFPETVDVREYDTVETKPIPPLDHKGHVTVNLNDVEPGSAVPLTLKVSIPPLAAANVIVWFRASNKPSLTTIRGQLKLGEGNDLALSETFTIIMHGDSP